MLRHALAFLAAVALAFSPLAVNAVQADCDTVGMDMAAMSVATPDDTVQEATASDPCCDHGEAMSAKDCVKACAAHCALVVAVASQDGTGHSPIAYRVAARWSNTHGQAHDPGQEDPPPRSLI